MPEISSIVTTTCVFDEVVTFFNSRAHHGKAVEIGGRLLRSPLPLLRPSVVLRKEPAFRDQLVAPTAVGAEDFPC